jgi:hypothetical protein
MLLAPADAPGEWFYDPYERLLYLYPNATVLPNALSELYLSVPLLERIITVTGGNATARQNAAALRRGDVESAQPEYARNISFVGLQFTGTRATFMEAYEVPSGGDW